MNIQKLLVAIEKKYFLVLLLLVSITAVILGFFLVQKMNHIRMLQAELNIETERRIQLEKREKILGQDLETRLQQLETHKELLRLLRADYNKNKSVSELEQMVTQATGVVAQLQKLENTDEELLAKYSKIYFLNEHYIPDNLTPIPSQYVVSGNSIKTKQEVLGFLLDMLDAMKHEGLEPRIVSGYRSFEYQQQLKERYKNQYGAAANTFSADQGFSEHQLGTTLDFSTKTNGGDLHTFENTEEYQWLVDNAHNYGFVLSYPNNNAYYTFEPWHWRFVGKALATELHTQGKYFYDFSQRKINNHLINIFDK